MRHSVPVSYTHLDVYKRQIVAWTLVKYDFPGKWLLDGLIELPFALPTAVAGITLSKPVSYTHLARCYGEHDEQGRRLGGLWRVGE